MPPPSGNRHDGEEIVSIWYWEVKDYILDEMKVMQNQAAISINYPAVMMMVAMFRKYINKMMLDKDDYQETPKGSP